MLYIKKIRISKKPAKHKEVNKYSNCTGNLVVNSGHILCKKCGQFVPTNANLIERS